MEPFESEEGLKNRAYLECTRLRRSGLDNEVIFARLEKHGIPEDLIMEVLKNVTIKQNEDIIAEQDPFFNSAVLRIIIGVVLAIFFAVAVPGEIILPIGSIIGGFISAYTLKSNVSLLKQSIEVISEVDVVKDIKDDIEQIVAQYSTEDFSVIYYGAHEIDAKYLVYWICVGSDKVKTDLENNIELNDTLRGLLVKHNYPVDAQQDVHIGFESQETVDRDSDGNWHLHFQ